MSKRDEMKDAQPWPHHGKDAIYGDTTKALTPPFEWGWWRR